jgi:hypothetical protein
MQIRCIEIVMRSRWGIRYDAGGGERDEGLQGGLCLTERGRRAAHAVRGSRD